MPKTYMYRKGSTQLVIRMKIKEKWGSSYNSYYCNCFSIDTSIYKADKLTVFVMICIRTLFVELLHATDLFPK